MEEVNEYALFSTACGAARSFRSSRSTRGAARAARAAGVFGGAPGDCSGLCTSASRPVVQKVNWPSIILGIIGWTLIGLTLLAMWMALRASASDPDPSGKDIIGFFPLFALVIIGPVNLAGGIAGIMGAVGKPKTLKLNWLGILLNASPYVIFTVLPFLLAILFGR